MSQLSKMRQSRNQWRAKAQTRGQGQRDQRKAHARLRLRGEGSVQAENADPLSLPLNRFFFVVICVIISLTIAWSTGYSTARDQRRFLVTHSPQERVVLRRYGDMFVIVDLDRSKRTVNQNFTFQAMTADPARVFTPSEVGPINVQRVP